MAKLDIVMTLYDTVRIQWHTNNIRGAAMGYYYYSMKLGSLIVYWATDMEKMAQL